VEVLGGDNVTVNVAFVVPVVGATTPVSSTASWL